MLMHERVEKMADGLWLVRFPTVADVTVEYSAPMVPVLVEACRVAPIVLMAHLPPDLRLVPPTMAPFWLNAFLLKGVRVKGIGVTSTSRAVKVVLTGVEAAMKVRGQPIPAQAFPTLEELIAWGKRQAAG
jgi:hypothetical protein